MCLTNPMRTEESKTRTIVYKIVRQYDDHYLALFEQGKNFVYHDNVLAISNREQFIGVRKFFDVSESEKEIKFGFHCFSDIETAKEFLNYMLNVITRCQDQELLHWKNAKLAIIECMVNPDDHIADGIFEIVKCADLEFDAQSCVYDKLTPIKMIQNAELKGQEK